MAEPVTVARPYAEAAFKLALESGKLQQWSDMLDLIHLVVTDENVAERIDHPNVGDQVLEGLILGSLGERLDGPGRNFVQVLVQNGRLDVMPQIRDHFGELKREHEGVVEARIISAMPMTEDAARPLLAALEAKYGRKVSAQIEVDPELIGGVRIILGDKVIDATVRGRLDAMRAALIH